MSQTFPEGKGVETINGFRRYVLASSRRPSQKVKVLKHEAVRHLQRVGVASRGPSQKVRGLKCPMNSKSPLVGCLRLKQWRILNNAQTFTC